MLSLLLFNIYGEWIIRKATEDWQGSESTGGTQISNLRYADDIIILANTEKEMALFLQRIEHYSSEAGLKLNYTKWHMMVVDREGILPHKCPLLADIERKENVIYLGACITNKGDSEEEIERMAKSAVTKLTKIWKDHHIRKNKIKG